MNNVSAQALASGTLESDIRASGEAVNDDILRVDHLTIRFGGLVAIDDVSFTAKRGNITAVIGPNGAGKTTLFNCLTGFYKPPVGRLEIIHPDEQSFLLEQMEGHEVSRKARVARTFQNIRLFSGMTVLENLLVAQHNPLMQASFFSIAGLLKLSSWQHAEKQAVERAIDWLRRVDLYDQADAHAGSLPYGAQRRLEIARAMCMEPFVLCLDEPAAGLDPRESAELNNLILEIRQSFGTSVLLIEHDMNVVMRISDHVIVLDYGQKISSGTPDYVRNDPAVIRAYLGEADEPEEQEVSS